MATRIEKDGNLEYHHYEGSEAPRVILRHCPICGIEFAHRSKRATHFLKEHTPDELGLGTD